MKKFIIYLAMFLKVIRTLIYVYIVFVVIGQGFPLIGLGEYFLPVLGSAILLLLISYWLPSALSRKWPEDFAIIDQTFSKPGKGLGIAAIFIIIISLIVLVEYMKHS